MMDALLQYLRRWGIVLVLAAIVGAAVGVAYTRTARPVYQASALLQIGGADSLTRTTPLDPQAVDQMASTYVELAQGRSILVPAAAQANIPASLQELQAHVAVKPIRGTQLMQVVASDPDPQRAANLANAVANTLVTSGNATRAQGQQDSQQTISAALTQQQQQLDAQTQLVADLNAQPASPSRDADLARAEGDLAQQQAAYGQLLRSAQDVQLANAGNGQTLSVVEQADVPVRPVGPPAPATIAAATLAALALAIVVTVLLTVQDDRIRDVGAVRQRLGLGTLGTMARSAGKAAVEPFSQPPRGAMRRLARTLELVLAQSNWHTLAVASARNGEGRTTTASGLAQALALSGQAVLLVDADYQAPSLTRRLVPEPKPGLWDLLRNAELSVADVVRPTPVARLSLLSAGAIPSDPSALLAAPELPDLLAELAGSYDTVLFDTPALADAPDAALLATRVDAVALVVNARSSRARSSAQALDLLLDTGATVVGAVLTGAPASASVDGGASALPGGATVSTNGLVSGQSASPRDG
jgi:non-specific protein-tyrosine kinase